MIEVLVIRHLEKKLPGIPIYAERPETDIPEEYIIIERTGGGRENYIDRATIVLQSHAESMFRAAELNREAEIAMRDFPEVPEISSCRLNSSYNFTDQETRKYRYQAVFDIIYMEGE